MFKSTKNVPFAHYHSWINRHLPIKWQQWKVGAFIILSICHLSISVSEVFESYLVEMCSNRRAEQNFSLIKVPWFCALLPKSLSSQSSLCRKTIPGMDRWMYEWVDRLMVRWKSGSVDEKMNEWVGPQMDGWMNRWIKEVCNTWRTPSSAWQLLEISQLCSWVLYLWLSCFTEADSNLVLLSPFLLHSVYKM